MRTMPRTITDPVSGEPIAVPAIPTIGWLERLDSICFTCTGRKLSESEIDRACVMSAHRWTIRTIADELFDPARVARYFSPSDEYARANADFRGETYADLEGGIS